MGLDASKQTDMAVPMCGHSLLMASTLATWEAGHQLRVRTRRKALGVEER